MDRRIKYLIIGLITGFVIGFSQNYIWVYWNERVWNEEKFGDDYRHCLMIKDGFHSSEPVYCIESGLMRAGSN